jgi:hypothetical protein
VRCCLICDKLNADVNSLNDIISSVKGEREGKARDSKAPKNHSTLDLTEKMKKSDF